jgi:hypothetical protein
MHETLVDGLRESGASIIGSPAPRMFAMSVQPKATTPGSSFQA